MTDTIIMTSAGRKPGGPKTGGRAKGTPNKVNSEIRSMIEQALHEAGGVQYLVRQADENPTGFMSLVGRILPKQIEADVNIRLFEDVLARARGRV